VVGASSRPRHRRTIGAGPRSGTTFDVEVDSHVTGILEHSGGALTTLVMSFDTWAARLPRIEVYGSEGTLSVPDPNYFGGAIDLSTATAPEWVRLPVAAGYLGAGRGYGVADLALSLNAGRPHRASAELGLHVLDVMESVQAAANTGTAVAVTTTCDRPEPVPAPTDLTRLRSRRETSATTHRRNP
jgi:predicted dehydrogenase